MTTTQNDITEKDWDKLYCCASLLVNSIEDREDSYTRLNTKLQMVERVLDSLETKYGPHPAIRALRGDYLSHASMGQYIERDSVH